MAKIISVKARAIFDSRGNPTVECEIKTKNSISRASVPSGASTGSHEAFELRDLKRSFHGMGVNFAVNNINHIISKKLAGKNPINQEEIDNLLLKLDGTPNKKRLGANAILAVSLAVARAGSAEKEVPLWKHIQNISSTKKCSMPVPAFNIINGGKHAGNNLEFQEYMLIPKKAKSFGESMKIGTEVYHSLKKRLESRFGKKAINVGDEGGFAPPFNCVEEPLAAISEAVINQGYEKNVVFGIDAAATNFWKWGRYHVEGKEKTPDQLLESYEELSNSFPLKSIEDPFEENDFEHFANLRRSTNLQIVGDDLLCTNLERIKKALRYGSCNCLLLKINQIGTLTEALKAAAFAKENGWNIMVSHRSGETEDSFIADLAVGIGASQIKAGAPCRSERLAKYNQLLRIEENKLPFAGKSFDFG